MNCYKTKPWKINQQSAERTATNNSQSNFLHRRKYINIIQDVIYPRKAPGYDLITWRLIKEIPRKDIVHLTTICNSIIGTGYFPVQWKVEQIIMIPKRGIPVEEASSYL
jgi:hypothetical protein